MAIEIDRNAGRIVGQFYDGSMGEHMVSVIEDGLGSWPHMVRRDDVLTGESHEIGFGVTRRAAFDQAYGSSLVGGEMYEAWRDQHREAAIALVTEAAERPDIRRVILEGPPIYLFPDPAYPMEDMSGTSSREGWATLDLLAETISHVPQEHFVLIDDFNGRPGDLVFVDQQVSLGILSHRARLNDLFILQSEGVQRMFLESEFLDQNDESRNRCSFLDAKFQVQKINSLLREDMNAAEISQALRETLFVVVHPTVFSGQQQMMLEAVLGEMKDHPLLKALPKQERMDLLGRLYVHIWVDDYGDVVGVTTPIWSKEHGRFEHMDISEAQDIRDNEDIARRIKEEEARRRREAYANRQ